MNCYLWCFAGQQLLGKNLHPKVQGQGSNAIATCHTASCNHGIAWIALNVPLWLVAPRKVHSTFTQHNVSLHIQHYTSSSLHTPQSSFKGRDVQ